MGEAPAEGLGASVARTAPGGSDAHTRTPVGERREPASVA